MHVNNLIYNDDGTLNLGTQNKKEFLWQKEKRQ